MMAASTIAGMPTTPQSLMQINPISAAMAPSVNPKFSPCRP
jgi:hypothetical protein